MTPWLSKIFLSRYPQILESVLTMHNNYNNGIEEILELERQGKAIVIYPRECFGIETLSKDKEGMQKLYELGYEDGKKIEEFVKKYREEKGVEV